jgi:hypothetical protein
MTKLEQFWNVYTDALRDNVTASPQDYALRANETPNIYAERTAANMRRNVEDRRPVNAGFARINYARSSAFRKAAKAVGVPFNLAGLNSLYDIEPLPRIPMHQCKMRHPKFGWQVIAVGDEEACRREYDAQVKTWPQYSFTITRTDDNIAQAWAIIESHDGAHDYRKGNG